MSLVRRSFAVLLALLVVLPFAGSVAAVPTERSRDVAYVPGLNDDSELVAAWQRWQAKGIDDYVTTVQFMCFCPQMPERRTVVRNDRIRKVTEGPKRLSRGKGHSMDQLFVMIREAQAEADEVRVTYSRRGVPRSIAIDPEKMMADEEAYYTVRLRRLR